jgi:hypothetical protein
MEKSSCIWEQICRFAPIAEIDEIEKIVGSDIVDNNKVCR